MLSTLPAFDRCKPSGVSDWRLAEPRAAPLCCPLTGARTREMSIREASPLGQYPTLPAGGEGLATSSIQGHGLPEPPKPRLLDRVRQALRARHMSRRTEEAYAAFGAASSTCLGWV